MCFCQSNLTVTLGHEGAGCIEKMHPSVENRGYAVGDKIGFLYINGCCFEYVGRCTEPFGRRALLMLYVQVRGMYGP